MKVCPSDEQVILFQIYAFICLTNFQPLLYVLLFSFGLHEPEVIDNTGPQDTSFAEFF